jgi:hypothetical protein
MFVGRSALLAGILLSSTLALAQGPGVTGGNMMGQVPMSPSGMMPMARMMMRDRFGVDHMEGRLAYIQTELKITQAQTPAWNTFVDAVRSNAVSMAEMRNAMMSRQGTPGTLPDRLAAEEKAVTAHLAAIKQIKDAVAKLYDVLNDDQKKIADTIVLGPMGMPMGMM